MLGMVYVADASPLDASRYNLHPKGLYYPESRAFSTPSICAAGRNPVFQLDYKRTRISEVANIERANGLAGVAPDGRTLA